MASLEQVRLLHEDIEMKMDQVIKALENTPRNV